MTPAVQLQAIDEIAAILSQQDAEGSPIYQKAVLELMTAIDSKGAEAQARLAKVNLSEINVLCADQQMGFVQWAGLNVIATFGRPDSLTPQVVKELVDKGRESNVTLIIDNLQSGADAGKAIAEELGCKRIILSNFPGGFDDTETWEKAIDCNIDLILEAVGN